MASLPDLRRITLLTVLAMATLCSVARSQDEPMGFSDFPPDSDFGGGADAPPGEFSLFGCFEVSRQGFSGLSLNSFYEDPTFVRHVHNTADLYSSPKTCNKLIAYIRANLPADAPKPMDDEYGCYLLNSAAYVCGNYSSSADIYKLGKVISPPGDDASGFPIAKSFSRGLIDIVYPVVGRCGASFNIYLSVDGYNTIADPESTAFEYVLANDIFDKCPTPKTGFPYCDCYRGEFNGRLSADKYNKRAPAPFGVKLGYYTKPYDARTNAHCFTLANPKEDGYGYPYEDFPDFTDKDPSPGTCGGSGEGFKFFNKLAKYEINLKYNLRHKIRGVLDASGKILPVSWAKDSKTGKWVDVVKVTNLSPSVTQQLINPGQTTMCLLVDKDTTMATLSADPNGIFFAFFDPTLKCCSRTYAYLLTPQGSMRRFKNMN